jgi:hypothetical protein
MRGLKILINSDSTIKNETLSLKPPLRIFLEVL